MSDWPLRPAEPEDAPALVELWHAGWHDGHAGIVPDALAAIRTRADFVSRMPKLLPTITTVGERGAPLGFCSVVADEIYQFYVAPEARGSGLAARLMTEGEQRIATAGHAQARLDVALGNDRAIRFYAKHGWVSQEPMEVALQTSTVPFKLRLLRMTKDLSGMV